MWSQVGLRKQSITTNKASGGDGIPVELFQILKDDAVKVLKSICQQICKTRQWPQDWKGSVFIPIPNGLWRRLSTEELMLLNCGVGEDSWESLGLQGDPTIHSEGDQTWDFFGRNDAKAETPVLWLPHAKSWLIGKESDAGRDLGQEEKGMTEDEMVGWHHRLDGHESE